MTNPEAARTFMLSEIEGLEAFDLLLVAPSGEPLHVMEVTRTEEGGLEVRVPGRPAFLPELEPDTRAGLRKLEFVAEDAADRTRPWTRAVDGPEAAVALMDQVRIEIFGEKPDASLNVLHGSHRTEHEAAQKIERARTRIESIVTEILGRRAKQDDDGDYVLPIGDVHVTVAPRATPDGEVIVRIFAITNVGVQVTSELGLFLARLNFGLMFGRFALDSDHRSIWFDETLLGEEFREEEMRLVIRTIASTADSWDDRLKQMFGGLTYNEALASRAREQLPPTKPGEGPGLYL